MIKLTVSLFRKSKMTSFNDKPNRVEKVSSLLKDKAADFFVQAIPPTPMVTITRAKINPDFQRATIYISVYPDNDEQKTLEFLRRQRSDLTLYLKKNTRLGKIPFIDIELDQGEKKRQRIDQLSQKT